MTYDDIDRAEAKEQNRVYTRIVFVQGEGADEPLRILDEDGVEAAIEYLAQWDMGDRDETFEEQAAGISDDTHETDDGFILTWNRGLGYIGLERVG